MKAFPSSTRGLVQGMKAMEEVVIEAAVSGDYGKVLQAFTINPLVPSGTKAKEMLDVMLVANKAYLTQFKAVITKLDAKGVTCEMK